MPDPASKVAPVNPAEMLTGHGQTTVPDILRRRVEATPDARFLGWEGGWWTCRELYRRVAGFAAWASAQPEGRIAGFTPNRPEAVVAWLGTLSAGRVYVPLNRALRGQMLADQLDRAGASVLMVDESGLPELPDRVSRRLVLLTLPDSVEESLRRAPFLPGDDDPRSPARPADVAEIIFTSGTTGRSKAVQVCHNGLARGAGWVAWAAQLEPTDVVHAWMPVYHIAAQVDLILAAMVAGSRIDLRPRFSLSSFWNDVASSGITVFCGFGNILEWLWEQPRPSSSTLRVGLIGGIPKRLHRVAEQELGVRLVDIYGMSEGEPFAFPHPHLPAPVGSCGRASPDIDLAVLDGADEPVPAGQVGQLAVRPRIPNVITPGYEHDAQASVDATRNLWFHTGDLGRVDQDGFVYYLGRQGQRLRRGGENVSAWEVEHALREHPGVADCVVVGVPAGAGGHEIKAVIVPAGEPSPADLRDWLRGRLAAFMVPRYFELVDALPRDALGKIQTRVLEACGPGTWDGGR